jgi:hypothetical protein
MLTINNDKYMVEKELSAKYGLSVQWFRRARYDGNSAVYHKLHGKIYYREADVDSWFKDNLLPSNSP